jgi:hypothetical protein
MARTKYRQHAQPMNLRHLQLIKSFAPAVLPLLASIANVYDIGQRRLRVLAVIELGGGYQRVPSDPKSAKNGMAKHRIQ